MAFARWGQIQRLNALVWSQIWVPFYFLIFMENILYYDNYQEKYWYFYCWFIIKVILLKHSILCLSAVLCNWLQQVASWTAIKTVTNGWNWNQKVVFNIFCSLRRPKVDWSKPTGHKWTWIAINWLSLNLALGCAHHSNLMMQVLMTCQTEYPQLGNVFSCSCLVYDFLFTVFIFLDS